MKPEIEYVYNKLKKLRFDFNSVDFRDFRSKYRYEPELNRYVRKDDNDLFIDKNTFKPLEEELEYADKCHNLEEQLGCPLEVLSKILENGFYEYYGYIPPYHFYRIDIFKKEIMYYDEEKNYFTVKLKDYKKTWWLREDKSE